MSYFVFFCWLFNVSCNGSVTSVGEERANFLLSFTCNYVIFCSERFPRPLGALDRLHYFILAFPETSI